MKNLLIVVLVLAFGLSGCGLIQIAPAATQTTVPTQTALPTYTPMPTYTPYPTQTLVPTVVIIPTEKPASFGGVPGYVQIDCPVSNWPAGVSDGQCYVYADGNAIGLVYLDSNGNPIVIGATVLISADVGYDAGVFLGTAAAAAGWNGEDVVGALSAITQDNVWVTYSSMQAKMTASDDGLYLSVYIKPAGSGL